MIRAHPLPRRERHVRQRRIQTVDVPVKGAVIAADDLPPERESDGRLTLGGDGSSFAGSVDGSGGTSTAVAENGSSFGVLEAKIVSIFGEASSTDSEEREERMDKGRERGTS